MINIDGSVAIAPESSNVDVTWIDGYIGACTIHLMQGNNATLSTSEVILIASCPIVVFVEQAERPTAGGCRLTHHNHEIFPCRQINAKREIPPAKAILACNEASRRSIITSLFPDGGIEERITARERERTDCQSVLKLPVGIGILLEPTVARTCTRLGIGEERLSIGQAVIIFGQKLRTRKQHPGDAARTVHDVTEVGTEAYSTGRACGGLAP